MNLWIQNIEKVVEDARETFAASACLPSPPLPIAPIKAPVDRNRSVNRTQKSARAPRRILAANEIFAIDGSQSPMTSPMTSTFADSYNQSGFDNSFNDNSLPSIPSEGPSQVIEVSSPVPHTPSRARRATVVTRSPEVHRQKPQLEIDTSPSKKREKSKSQNDLGRPITPVTKLEFEIERLAKAGPTPPPRLSTIVDKSLFIADSSISRTSLNMFGTPERNSLTSSPMHVEPYPARPVSKIPTMDTPAKKHAESVYDRFLMSTTGVKRVGKGYQSNNAGPISNTAPLKNIKRNENFFRSTRKVMPPPVSSEDWRKSASVDEFGAMAPSENPVTSTQKGENVGIVRRALRTMVNGRR